MLVEMEVLEVEPLVEVLEVLAQLDKEKMVGQVAHQEVEMLHREVVEEVRLP